jgi:hypothetical protein
LTVYRKHYLKRQLSKLYKSDNTTQHINLQWTKYKSDYGVYDRLLRDGSQSIDKGLFRINGSELTRLSISQVNELAEKLRP